MNNIVPLNNYTHHENLAEQMAWDLEQSSKILLGMAAKGSVDSVIAVKSDIAEAYKVLARLLYTIHREERQNAGRKHSRFIWQIAKQNERDGYGH